MNLKNFLFLISICLLILGCGTNNNKLSNNEIKIEFSDSLLVRFESEISIFNPLYELSDFGEEIDSIIFFSFKEKYSNPIQDSNIIKSNEYFNVLTNYGDILFKDNSILSDMYTTYDYLGYSNNKKFHIINYCRYENISTILLDNDDYQSFQINGFPYFSQNSNSIVSYTENIFPIHYSILNLYEYNQNSININYSLWSNIPIKDICWGDNSILIKRQTTKSQKCQYLKIDLDVLSEKLENQKNQEKSFADSETWADIYYIYPFDLGSGKRGTYYVLIKKDALSEFATSFGGEDYTTFKYDISPFYKKDTLYLAERDSPVILGKIIKIENDYYIQSDLIKLYTDEIEETEHGYKLNKGYPED